MLTSSSSSSTMMTRLVTRGRRFAIRNSRSYTNKSSGRNNNCTSVYRALLQQQQKQKLTCFSSSLTSKPFSSYSLYNSARKNDSDSDSDSDSDDDDDFDDVDDDDDDYYCDDDKPRRPLKQIRFNKLAPLSCDSEHFRLNALYVEGVHKRIFPLTRRHYPLRKKGRRRRHRNRRLVYDIVHHTKADSVVLKGDYELDGKKPKDYYDSRTRSLTIDTKDKAMYPNDDGYWNELGHVVDMQIARRNKADPSKIILGINLHNNGDRVGGGGGNWLPELWNGWSLDQIADAVRGEYPVLHQQNCLESFWKSNDGIDLYKEGKPFRSVVDFVGKQVRLADINTWTFHQVAPVNFMLKWHVGMPRPEEVAWLIATNELTTEQDNVPDEIVTKIKRMRLKGAYDFTRYKTSGCPSHPSWPAMHSAGSTLSLWLPSVAKLSVEQYCEALRVDYGVAYGRTVAGVHYQQDNLAGLNIGQHLIKECLPNYLRKKFGYDESTIRSRLHALSFDWKTFDPVNCTIDGIPAGDFLEKATSCSK